MSRKAPPADWDDYVRELGLILQRHRSARALSQEDVAYSAGLTRSHYQQLEKGRSRPELPANPSLLTLVSLADALNVDVRELLPDQRPAPHNAPHHDRLPDTPRTDSHR